MVSMVLDVELGVMFGIFCTLAVSSAAALGYCLWLEIKPLWRRNG